MAFQSIGRILPKAMHEAGISKQVTAARVVEEATKKLQLLWGEEKARYVEVVSFADGALKWRTASSVALQELKLTETRLINDLNRELGSRVIRSFIYTGR
ncbi:MAG: DciA family protein [bacterium]|nr:DciA family protein [bacterium]